MNNNFNDVIVLANPEASLVDLQKEIQTELNNGCDPFKELDSLGKVIDNLIVEINTKKEIFIVQEFPNIIVISGYDENNEYKIYLKIELEDWIQNLYDILFESATVGEFIHNYVAYIDDVAY